jgi:hypothetical protein
LNLEYGVYGYILLRETHEPFHPDQAYLGSCNCGGAGFVPKLSGTNNEDGYWEIPFTAAEANGHDEHTMVVSSYFHGESAESEFHKPVTGPIYIYIVP